MVSSASEAVDKEPGRRHGDGEQRPASQPLGQKYPHARCPLFRPAEPGLLCRLGGDSQWTAQRARRITAWRICFACRLSGCFPGRRYPSCGAVITAQMAGCSGATSGPSGCGESVEFTDVTAWCDEAVLPGR